MKTRLAALFCALTATACGSSDHPAQDPSTAMATQSAAPDSTHATASTTAGSMSITSADATGRAVPGGAVNPARTNGSTAYSAPELTKADAGIASSQAASDMLPGAASNQADSNVGRSPDNSAVNERDRHATLTPMDQGGKDSERQLTAAIRRAVVADKSLSFTAKNVKIITVGSKVTLRGTVKTDQERSSIEALARQTQGVTEVDNQIEVKGK